MAGCHSGNKVLLPEEENMQEILYRVIAATLLLP
jgi:hypothetical protein